MQFLLGGGRQIPEVIEKIHDLPDFAIGHDRSPGGHAGPAHAIFDEEEGLVLRLARRLSHELRRPRMEGASVIALRIIGPAVTVGALVAIKTRAIDQVGFGRRDRVLEPGRVALGESIQRGTRQF